MVFDGYAHYYDLLYQDKDYTGEVAYIEKILNRYKKGWKTLADIGCGTGRHAEIFAKKGYVVTGIERSEEMLENARRRVRGQGLSLSFFQGTLQDFTLEKPVDVITALFHVISYQTTNAMCKEAFSNIYKNLHTDGIFLFDCWYMPAVLWQRPALRVKRMERDVVRVTRIAEPVMCFQENLVEVNYDIFVENRQDDTIKELKELHELRYFTAEEIKCYAEEAGFRLMDAFEFLTDAPLSEKTWGSCFVVQK